MQENKTDPKITMDFNRRRQRQLVALIPLILAFLPLFILDKAGPKGLWGIPTAVLGPTCLVVVIAVLVFSFVNWRCPSCKGYLGKAINPRFCQKCGVPLRA